MLIYYVEKIPDLTLSKYQVFADTGIDGMLEAQTQFIKQLHRTAIIGNIDIHFYYEYIPENSKGNKINIYIIFDNATSDEYYVRVRKVIEASNVFTYYQLKEVSVEKKVTQDYKYMSVIKKKDRRLQTVINSEEKYYYLVPNWKIKDEARLFSLFKLMQSFDEKCCYRVDLFVEKNLQEEIHESFEGPLSILRNLSSNTRGISELSKIDREKHDPNADETLKQYEEWLKEVDLSHVYRARICAFTNDEQYGQLLLDSALSESLESGNGNIEIIKGEYNSDSLVNECPNTIVDNVPKTMQKWSTTYTVNEIASFCRLPILYDGENIEIPKETTIELDKEGIVLGNNDYGQDVVIPLELLPKHMFVCGVPGSGKTNTMLHLASSLWRSKVEFEDGKYSGVPFLVLEPAKKEYRELATMNIPELLLFSPSSDSKFQLTINPFEFAIGLTLSEHIENLCKVFEGAFPVPAPAPFILDRAIEAVYIKHNWNVYDKNIGDKEYPTMQELYEQFEKELETTNYDNELKGNIRSVLEMRIGSLLRREKKEIFDVKKSVLSPEEWLKYPVVIELEALGEGPANFVTLLLCTLVREVLKVNPIVNSKIPIRHVIFIEEAHNLIAPVSQIQNGEDSNPKIAATSFIVKMLAEVRALKEGIIIADQLPTAMAPEVIKNTNIKLVHRLTSGDDRELIGSTMSASGLQIENLATYTQGRTLYTYEKMLRPFEMKVKEVEEHGKTTPNDEELYELMKNREVYREIRSREELHKINNIKNEVAKWIKDEAITLLKIEEYIAVHQKNGAEDVLGTLENHVNLGCIFKNKLKRQYIEINDDFVSEEKKQDVINAIDCINKFMIKKYEELSKVYFEKRW